MALFKAVKKPVIRQAASDGPAATALRPRYVPKAAPCGNACPIGCDVRGALTALSEGESMETAWRRITARNPFPALTGRECDHPCEDGCLRKAGDGAVSIQAVERFLGDYAIEQKLQFPRPKALGKEVGIEGTGVAAWSAAYHLARRGYGMTVFGDADGGDLEIQRILALGVELYRELDEDRRKRLSYRLKVEDREESAAQAIARGMAEAEAADALLRGVAPPKPTPRPAVAFDRIKLAWYPAARRLEPAAAATAEAILVEARRCMSCGMCMACGNCWMYCSHGGFEKLPNGRRYRLKLDACNGCKKCAEECPSGYIDMI